MAGNSSRKGAIRQSKKGPSSGTGGKNKKRLTGKGPTPKAEDRPYHAAAKRKKAAEKKATRSPCYALNFSARNNDDSFGTISCTAR